MFLQIKFLLVIFIKGHQIIITAKYISFILTTGCSGIQLNLLLSPYPCFISLLYLDLYVLGDDALIS